jgi:uncharacterized protein (DUF58 family)
VLTRSGWGALVIALVGFATGRVFGILELYILGAGVVAAVLLAVASALRRPPQLGVRRLLEPSIVRAGETARVDVQVVNLGRRRTPVVQLWEPVGPTGGATMNLAPLKRHETADAAYRLPTSRRGAIRVGPMQARRRDVLGLCSTSFVLHGSVELLVIPTYTPTPFSLGGSSGRLGEHLRLRGFGQSGSEFHSLREYVRGDDLRRISWKASARSSEFIVKETAIEGVRRCTVVVDVDDDAYDEAGFERAMSAAAGLVTGAVAAGLTTRLISPDVDLRGLDVAPLALRWLATAMPQAGERLALPSLRSGEGMGVLVVVTGSPTTRRVSEVRAGLSPDDTLIIVAATAVAESAVGTRFVVDATSDEAFRTGWAHLTGSLSARRSSVDGPVAVGG